MSKGALEVLLIDAKGLADTDAIGESLYIFLSSQHHVLPLAPLNSFIYVADIYEMSTGKIDPYVVIEYRDQERKSKTALGKYTRYSSPNSLLDTFFTIT